MGGGRKLLPVTTFTVAKRKPEKNSGFYGIRTLNRRAVTKISSCQVNTTSRRGIKELGISFGSIFLLFSYESSRGPRS